MTLGQVQVQALTGWSSFCNATPAEVRFRVSAPGHYLSLDWFRVQGLGFSVAATPGLIEIWKLLFGKHVHGYCYEHRGDHELHTNE